MTGATELVIPFYGARDRRMFEIERRCMDREGVVVRHLDEILPAGRILDVGAGDGFTAARLRRSDRTLVALEPSAGMIDRGRHLPWVRGVAQSLPFADGAFAGAYATWAYFFPEIGHGPAGLREFHRAVVDGGPSVVVDNAGDDEFSAFGPAAQASNPAWWRSQGFDVKVLASCFRFDSLAEAADILEFYFGERGRSGAKLEVEYKIAVYVRRSRGA